MKIRNRSRVLNKAKGKRAPNPLRIDPTRTATLRRQFLNRIRQRFKRLRLKLYQLIVDEDAFGLSEKRVTIDSLMKTPKLQRLILPTENAFCPMGPGGGQDNSCSPSGSGGGEATSEDSLASKGFYLESFHKIWLKEGTAKLLTVKIEDVVSRSKEPISDVKADNPTVKSMKDDLDSGYRLPVIELTRTEGGKFRIADGRHRLTAQRLRGMKTIPAIVTNSATLNAGRWQFQNDPEKISNAFCPTGIGGGHDNSCSPSSGGGSSSKELPDNSFIGQLKQLGAHAGHAEHVAKAYASDKIGAAIAKLPLPAQKAVNRAYAVAKLGTQAAFATWTAGQALAERVSKERGSTDEEARRLRGVLSSMDIAAFKPLSVAIGATGVGAAAAGALSMIPPVTASYLAYSTARNPLATYRAAKGMVRDAIGKVISRIRDKNTSSTTNGYIFNAAAEQSANIIADALENHDYADWYVALLSAALEETDDILQAILVANTLYDEYPKPSISPEDDDWAAVSDQWVPVDNAFCATGQGGGVDPSCGKDSTGAASPETIAKGKDQVIDKMGQMEDDGKDDTQEYKALSVMYQALASKGFIATATNGDKVVAAGSLDKRGDDTARVSYIGSIEKGGGSKVMEKLIAEARRLGVKHITADATLDAVKLNKKFGFEVTGDKTSNGIPMRLTLNVFCATGSGGGVDPSCGSSEGGGGGISLSSGNSQVDSIGAKLPEVAGKLAKAYLKSVEVHKDSKALTKALQARYGSGIREGHREASYSRRDGILYLTKGASDSAVAHEMGHVVDGPGESYSNSPEFKAAWKKEASKLSEALKSDYPKYHPAEALAEMFRMRHEQGAAAVETLVPKMVKALGTVWKKESEGGKTKGGTGKGRSKGKPTRNIATNAGRWQFQPDPDKIKAFKAWIKSQIADEITSKTEEQIWRAYVEAGFRKGAGRAFDDVKKPVRQALLDASQERLGFYQGTRDEFLRSTFAQPVAVEKVQLLAGRSFDDLENVTADMSTRMTRTLTDGLVQGKSPRDIASDLSEEVGLSEQRATVIARTEIIRAHAEGQLTAMENLGVEEVGVAVEWSTVGDHKVCELCAPLEGVILKLDEARGMIPRHPNCRCAWIPANVGEDDSEQKDTKKQIKSALKDSAEAGGDDFDLDIDISTDRPRSVLNQFLLDLPEEESSGSQDDLSQEMLDFSRWAINAFCPTGAGGGVDPSCGKEGGAISAGKETTYLGVKVKVVGKKDAKTTIVEYTEGPSKGKKNEVPTSALGVKTFEEKQAEARKQAEQQTKASEKSEKSQAPSAPPPQAELVGIKALKHAEKLNAGWKGKLDKEELDAVNEFKRQSSLINDVLRTGKAGTYGFWEPTAEQVSSTMGKLPALEKAFAKLTPLTADLVMYRGQEGEFAADPGFTHVTGMKKHAENFGQLITVRIPKGTRVLPMRVIGDNEPEVVLPRGSRLTRQPNGEFLVSTPLATINAFCPTGQGGGVDPTCSIGEGASSISVKDEPVTPPKEKTPTLQSIRAKQSHVMVDGTVQRYAEEHNEPRMAKVLKGKSLPDGEPMDIETETDLVELKTMVIGKTDGISMNSYAQVRKIEKERETGKTFHTIVSDDRQIFNADGPGQHGDPKNRVYYYRRGVAGSAKLSTMHKVTGGEKELLALMKMADKDLPEAAKRTDGHLRKGKWKFFEDKEGKGYKNRTTGKIFRAKK